MNRGFEVEWQEEFERRSVHDSHRKLEETCVSKQEQEDPRHWSKTCLGLTVDGNSTNGRILVDHPGEVTERFLVTGPQSIRNSETGLITTFRSPLSVRLLKSPGTMVLFPSGLRNTSGVTKKYWKYWWILCVLFWRDTHVLRVRLSPRLK